MRYRVGTTGLARSDLYRVSDFLAGKDPVAAHNAVELILEGIISLEEMPERGHLSTDGSYRELHLPFGAGAYVLQYRIDESEVTVLRIFHSLEDR